MDANDAADAVDRVVGESAVAVVVVDAGGGVVDAAVDAVDDVVGAVDDVVGAVGDVDGASVDVAVAAQNSRAIDTAVVAAM